MLISKEDFEKTYAEKSNLTVEQLNLLGLHAELCDCGDQLCKGWAMVSHDFDVKTEN